MCYELDARPPYPPIAGGAASGESITLRSADGTEFAAFCAKAASQGGAGIVVLPDVRGLHPFFEDLAVRFAEVGVHATAMDYFGRTAGTERRAEGFEFMPHVQQTKPETLTADVAATIAHLRSDDGGGAENIFTVGFCMGGRISFNQAAAGQGLSGAISFYGWPVRRGDSDENAPIDKVADFACPVLGLFGGADQGIPMEHVEAFEKALAESGKPYEIKVYEDAPHSFFDRGAVTFKAACDDAWTRMLDFIKANG